MAILQPLLPGTPEVRSAYVAALGQGGETRDLKAFAEQVLDDPDLEPEIRSALLFALLENGAADMALPRLRELARRDPKTWELAYFDALRRAGTIEERVGVLTARLDANPAPAARDQLLFELLEAGGPAAALPYLKRAAEGDPDGTWPASYEAALAELGRTEELVAWLTTRAKLPGTPERVRRELAFRLLDLNALRQAEAVFLDLATGAPTTSPDVQQLLYLWGPKPPERGIEWLVARTRGAEAEDRGRWLGLLANMRAWDQIVALGSRPGPASAKDPALAPLINALIATRRRAEVSAVLDPLIAKTDDPKDLLQMADWAEQAERSDTSVAAYQRAMTRIGDDPEALLRAGRAFTFAGRAELAKETLERYFRAPGNKGDTDHRPWYYYGQSLSQMNRQPEAREAYRRMLSNMQQNGASDFDSRRMAATGHEALGDGERAVEIYEGLLAERPRDRSLVADFAALLIELRQFERAETLLSQN
ncbi:MAG: tetratricopeptide repeat protein [Minwuia sp.]|uniref:tetratricopeptide repeat protein n=1 Tax=Minwuia sp. TaxID=2493630 RepID=UPI003A88CF83